MKRTIFNEVTIICIITLLCSSCNEDKERVKETDPLKEGYVPNKETAINIAEAVWLPIYGNKIFEERPFHANLKNDSIWVVEGTVKKDRLGGTAYAEIHKWNGKVLKITHYK